LNSKLKTSRKPIDKSEKSIAFLFSSQISKIGFCT
jgi:hypothetical protein